MNLRETNLWKCKFIPLCRYNENVVNKMHSDAFKLFVCILMDLSSRSFISD